jgi:hypothetical protein
MSNINYVFTTRKLIKLIDSLKDITEKMGTSILWKNVHVASSSKWVSLEEFRDQASRLELLEYFSNLLTQQGSLRPSIPTELVLVLDKHRVSPLGLLVAYAVEGNEAKAKFFDCPKI